MDELLETLETAIAAVQGAELVGLGSVALTGLLSGLETLSRRLDSGIRGLVAEIDRRGVAGEYAATSTAALLSQRLLITGREASARVRQAKELTARVALTGEVLPPLFGDVAAALDAGEISLAHAKVITTTRSDLPAEVDAAHGDAVEAFLVEQARHLNPTQLNNVAIRLRDTLNPDGKYTDDADQQRRRDFGLREHTDGSSTPYGRFTPELTALLRPVLDSLSAPQPGELPDTRTPGQRRHDGIADAAMLLLRSGTLPDAGGCPVSIRVTVTAEDLTKAQNGAHVLVTDDYGTPISLDTITAISSEIEFSAIRLNTCDGIDSFGRTRRLATTGQRRALAVRDKGCSFPGCTRHSAWAEIHHIQEWLNGGTTDLDNLVMLCRYHHRHFAAAGWQVRMGDGNTPEWIPPTWIDEHQQPRHNTTHDTPRLPELV